MRTIILDGYNVILRSPAFRPDESRDLEAARNKLENLLSWTLGSTGDAEFVLVFDGADVAGTPGRKKTGPAGRVDVRFSTPPQKADDLIKALVEEWSETRDMITVVTSDLEIAQHARAHGASVVLSDLFAASLFKERVEERLNEAMKKGKASGKATRKAARKATGSPTAQGSDAEPKPEGVSKKKRKEWLKLFEEQREEES